MQGALSITCSPLELLNCCFKLPTLAGLYRYKLLPTKEALTTPRNNIEDFTIFCNYFLICTHGKQDFKKHVKDTLVSSFTTVSTEAYTIAYIENSYDNWLAEADDKTTDPIERKSNRVKYAAKKWTGNAHAAKIYGGWHNDGLTYYMHKADEVDNERKTGDHHDMEEAYRIDATRTFARKVRAPRALEEETDLVLKVYSDDEEDKDEDEDKDEEIRNDQSDSDSD